MLPGRRRLACTIFLAAAVVFGCGKKADTSAANSNAAPIFEEVASPASTSNADPPSGNPIAAPLTKDDIGRWEKGLAGEMMAVQEMTTMAAGAQAAGIDQERYQFVRGNLSAVVGYLTPQLGGIDPTMLTPAQRDEMRKGNEAQLQRMQESVPADVVEALKPRAVELRKKDLELVGARLKSAGM